MVILRSHWDHGIVTIDCVGRVVLQQNRQKHQRQTGKEGALLMLRDVLDKTVSQDKVVVPAELIQLIYDGRLKDAIEMVERDCPEIIDKLKPNQYERVYDPKYGNNVVCECGHHYSRHFDPDFDGAPSCKYCDCMRFKEAEFPHPDFPWNCTCGNKNDYWCGKCECGKTYKEFAIEEGDWTNETIDNSDRKQHQ